MAAQRIQLGECGCCNQSLSGQIIYNISSRRFVHSWSDSVQHGVLVTSQHNYTVFPRVSIDVSLKDINNLKNGFTALRRDYNSEKEIIGYTPPIEKAPPFPIYSAPHSVEIQLTAAALDPDGIEFLHWTWQRVAGGSLDSGTFPDGQRTITTVKLDCLVDAHGQVVPMVVNYVAVYKDAWGNQRQRCESGIEVPCPCPSIPYGGSTTAVEVESGTYIGASQADANAKAYEVACNQSAALAVPNQCWGDLYGFGPLTNYNQALADIEANGGFAAYEYHVGETPAWTGASGGNQNIVNGQYIKRIDYISGTSPKKVALLRVFKVISTTTIPDDWDPAMHNSQFTELDLNRFTAAPGVGNRYRGAWSNAVDYVDGEIVLKDAAYYIAEGAVVAGSGFTADDWKPYNVFRYPLQLTNYGTWAPRIFRTWKEKTEWTLNTSAPGMSGISPDSASYERTFKSTSDEICGPKHVAPPQSYAGVPFAADDIPVFDGLDDDFAYRTRFPNPISVAYDNQLSRVATLTDYIVYAQFADITVTGTQIVVTWNLIVTNLDRVGHPEFTEFYYGGKIVQTVTLSDEVFGPAP